MEGVDRGSWVEGVGLEGVTGGVGLRIGRQVRVFLLCRGRSGYRELVNERYKKKREKNKKKAKRKVPATPARTRAHADACMALKHTCSRSCAHTCTVA